MMNEKGEAPIRENDIACMQEPEMEEKVKMPMKWHKFLIYVTLWVGAFNWATGALQYFSGMHYGFGMAKDVYAAYPALRFIDLLMGAASIGMAVLTLKTRFALARYEAAGPNMLSKIYVYSMVMNLAYPLLMTMVTGVGGLMTADLISDLITSAAFLFINKSYYKKRAALFVN